MSPLMCLAVAVYFEARGEPLDGQYAVAEVIMNRVEDNRYPDTVCGVVFEGRQFSFTHDGKPDRLPKKATRASKTASCETATPTDVELCSSLRAKRIASEVLEGYRVGITSTHYHTTAVDPFWTDHYELDGMVGNHLFYTNNTPYR